MGSSYFAAKYKNSARKITAIILIVIIVAVLIRIIFPNFNNESRPSQGPSDYKKSDSLDTR